MQLPTVDDLKREFPVTKEQRKQVQLHRQEIQHILAGTDSRLLVIVGPCSAWPSQAVLEYAKQLKQWQQQYESKIKFVLRVYTQKPRTTVGWMGPLIQPDPFSDPDIAKGQRAIRSLCVQLNDMGIALADEALFLDLIAGHQDLLSWMAVGARSTENQQHRLFASGVNMPVGFKNPTSGDIETGVQSIVAAQQAQVLPLHGKQIQTIGNPFAHLILRGGKSGTNYDLSSMQNVDDLFTQYGIGHPAVVVDASHGNAILKGEKNHLQQVQVIQQLLQQRKKYPNVYRHMKGVMIESFIQDGKQSITNKKTCRRDGLSITDPCLGIEQTELLIKDIAAKV